MSRSTDGCRPNNTTVWCSVSRDAFPIMATAVGHAVPRGPTQLHLAGRGRRCSSPTRIQHVLTNNGHFQEAMLACIDISKPTYAVSQDLGLLSFSENNKLVFEISAQLSSCRIPMTWFCEMANSVLGEKGELLEYRHLISNPKTKAVWAHSYGNEI